MCVEAVVTKRTQVFNALKCLYLNCETCGHINGPFEINTEEDQYTTRVCIECQNKGPWAQNVEKTRYYFFSETIIC